MSLLDKLFSGFAPAAALKRGLKLQEAGDVKNGFGQLSKAARAGIPEAEFRVGRCYLEGSGVPPSRADGVLKARPRRISRIFPRRCRS